MKAKNPKPKATDATIEQRIQAVLQIRLDGAEGWDVRLYVAEKEAAGEQPWKLEEGEAPMSERQVRRYVTWADNRISNEGRISAKKALRRHMGQRRNLYARAVQAGDLRTALAILSDLANLQDLYPAKKVKQEHSGKIGHHYGDLTDEELEREVQRLASLRNSDGGAGSEASEE